jgi:hypothetical protein
VDDKFHQRFNIEVGIVEAKRRFVNRTSNYISDILKWADDRHYRRTEVEKFICTKLGERWQHPGCLSTILGNNFNRHVRALEALYECDVTVEVVLPVIQDILKEVEVDIGIRWDSENRHFLPSGSPLLDKKLVDDVLGVLNSQGYDGVLTPFRKGLDHFLHSIKNQERLADVITDMYEALEALAKIITTKDRDLSANAELFISKLNVSEEYKPILKAYIGYAHEFRHAAEKGQKKAIPPQQEVESFIYLTGLFVRLALI